MQATPHTKQTEWKEPDETHTKKAFRVVAFSFFLSFFVFFLRFLFLCFLMKEPFGDTGGVGEVGDITMATLGLLAPSVSSLRARCSRAYVFCAAAHKQTVVSLPATRKKKKRQKRGEELTMLWRQPVGGRLELISVQSKGVSVAHILHKWLSTYMPSGSTGRASA